MSSLQDKLLNCEVTPPGIVWDKIAAALDNPVSIEDEYPSRLYNYEQEPPHDTWTKIETALDQDNPATPVRRIPFLRYAVAAAVMGAIAFGIIKWTGSGTTGVKDISTITATNQPAAKSTIPVAPAAGNTDTGTDSPATQQKTKADYRRLDQLARTNMKKALASKQTGDESGIEPDQALYAYEDHAPDLAERYVMLMTPEGSIIRMSKKLGNLICCVSGEEQGPDCKDQLKKWQEKMATSSLAPSPGNFLDILSLVNSLNDSEL